MWILCCLLTDKTSPESDYEENDDPETDDFGKIGSKNRLPHRLPESNW